MKRFLQRLGKRSGVTLFEYTLIVAIVSIAGVLLLHAIGTTTANSMTPVNNALER